MGKFEIVEDVTFLLYITPLLINIFYAFYIWLVLNLPFNEVYIKVNNDNIVLLVSIFVIITALIIEIWMYPKDVRIKKIEENILRMRILAILFIILSLIYVLIVIIYSPIILNFFDLYLEGRYAILYPLFLLSLSLVLSNLNSIKRSLKLPLLIFEIIPIILIVSSPLLVYIFWHFKLSYNIIFSIPFLIFIIGITIFLYRSISEEKLKIRN
ncbi:MAG: hypothetical protein QXD42_04550 [Nitrososphaerales archaeon]